MGKESQALQDLSLLRIGNVFLFLLIVGCLAAVVVNYGCAISFSVAILFPIICSVQLRSMAAFAILTVCSMAIVHKHMDNIQKIRVHKEMPIRQFLGNYIFGRGWQWKQKRKCGKSVSFELELSEESYMQIEKMIHQMEQDSSQYHYSRIRRFSLHFYIFRLKWDSDISAHSL